MLAVCLTAAASLTSVITVPLFVNAAFRHFPYGRSDPRLPVLVAAVSLFLVSTLPVIAGMVLRRLRPAAAAAVEARIGGVGLAVLVVVIAASVWSEQHNVLPALARAGGPALVLNLLGVALGWGSATLAGLPRPQRIAVALECGLQNFAMAAFVSLTLLSDAPLLLPGIAYGLTMYLSAGAVVLASRRSAGFRRA
jgi:BASS family bile acid:Na+ symporter